MALTTEVLPAPERPNSAVRPRPAAKVDVERESRRAGARYRPRASVSRRPAAGRCAGPADRRRAARSTRARSRPGSGAARRHRRPAFASGCRSPTAIVCVSPGMLDTKVIVAPNSPRLRAKRQDHAGDDPGRDQRQGDRQRTRRGCWRRACPRPPRAGGRPPRARGGSPAPSAESP